MLLCNLWNIIFLLLLLSDCFPTVKIAFLVPVSLNHFWFYSNSCSSHSYQIIILLYYSHLFVDGIRRTIEIYLLAFPVFHHCLIFPVLICYTHQFPNYLLLIISIKILFCLVPLHLVYYWANMTDHSMFFKSCRILTDRIDVIFIVLLGFSIFRFFHFVHPCRFFYIFFC